MVQNDIRIILGTRYSRRAGPRGVSLPKTVSNELEVTGQSRWRLVQRKIAVTTGTRYSHRDLFATTSRDTRFDAVAGETRVVHGKEGKKEKPSDKGTGEMRNVRVLCRIKRERSHTGSDRKVVSGGRWGGGGQGADGTISKIRLFSFDYFPVSTPSPVVRVFRRIFLDTYKRRVPQTSINTTRTFLVAGETFRLDSINDCVTTITTAIEIIYF